MNNYKQLLLLFWKRILILFIFYQICRLLFWVFNKSAFSSIDGSILLGGSLYDFAAIGFINLIFVSFYLFPGNFKYNLKYQKVLKIVFFTVNILFLATNFVDFEYYKFTGRRSSMGLITAKGMENEIMGLIPSFLKEFWYLPLLFILFSYLIWKLFSTPKITNEKDVFNVKIVSKQVLLFIISIGSLLLMARGGTGKKPIRIVDAINYSSIGNSALVMNTPFCILKTIGKKETLVDPKFFEEKELKTIFNPVFQSNSKEKTINKNVVIIILESFGDENLRLGYTPFLDSLITKSYYFKNGFANGKLSIDAVPSTLSSVPSLMNTSFISSSYSLNKVYGFPKIMKNSGYSTSFFHGAFNGSQNFDQYCKVAGFDNYFGKNEYVGPEAFDGRWGIFDEEFLQFFCQKLTSFKQPFFSTVFTISSHNPFIIPEKHKGKFKKGTSKIHETIGYADFSLQKFFSTAKKQSWYNNTLFVILADHTSPFGEVVYKTTIGKFKIPILFFDPSNPNLQGVSDKNFQQIDILPSVLDYLNNKEKIVTFGKSFKSDKNFVITYLDNVYNYINNDYYLAFDGTKSLGLYNWKTDGLLKNNLLQKEEKTKVEMERFIKAYIQTFNQRIINDDLTIK